MSVTAVKDQVYQLWTQQQNDLDALRTEMKSNFDTLGDMPAEAKAKFEKMNSDINSLMKQYEELERSGKRPAHFGGSEKSQASKTFANSIRSAHRQYDKLSDEEKKQVIYQHMPQEQKLLYSADATTGGFFATPQYMDDIIKAIVLISPFRQLANQLKTSNERVMVPKRSQTASAYWAAEQSQYTESQNPKFGMVEIVPYELRGLLEISQQNLEDSYFDLESFLMAELSEQFAKAEGLAFIKGTGVEQPAGVMVDTTIPYQAAGSTSQISADNVLKLMHAVKTGYRVNGTFIMTTATLGVLRLLKDSQNRPLWQPFAAGGLPATIYDRPYQEMPDMDDVVATTGANAYTYNANTFPLAFGDFKRGYTIVDRVQMAVKQLDELFALSSAIGYIARRRVGGQVVLSEAIIKLKMSVS